MLSEISDTLRNAIRYRIDDVCDKFSRSQEYSDVESKIIAQRTEIISTMGKDMIKLLNNYDDLCIQLQCMTYNEIYKLAYKDGVVSRLDLTPNMTPE